MDHHAPVGGLLYPEGAEERELLAIRLAGPDREAARAQPEDLPARQSLEVTRAREDEEGLECSSDSKVAAPRKPANSRAASGGIPSSSG